MRRTVILLSLLAITGCHFFHIHRDQGPPHTHLWVGDREINLWTYQRVSKIAAKGGGITDEDDFLKQEIQPGDQVLLENGTVIFYDGHTVRVNRQKVDAKNAFIDPTGRVRPGGMTIDTD